MPVNIFKNAVTNAINSGGWYKMSLSKNEVSSNFPKAVIFEANGLPGAAPSAYGKVFQLLDKKSKNKFKYVLKAMYIPDKNELKMFEDEVYTGTRKDAAVWGTRIYAHTVVDPKSLSTQSIHFSKIDSRSFPLIGIYIMQHVMKGRKPSSTQKFTTLEKFIRMPMHNSIEVREQLIKKLRYTLRMFYKSPKIHGDLHHNNILIVYTINPNTNNVAVKSVFIIDYGATYHFQGNQLKTFSGKNKLSNIFYKQRNIITKNKQLFKYGGLVWPPKTKIKVYNKTQGGQQLRLNKELLNLYIAPLMKNILLTNQKNKEGSVKQNLNSIITEYASKTPVSNKQLKAEPTPPRKSSTKQLKAEPTTPRKSPKTPIKSCRCQCGIDLKKTKKGSIYYQVGSKKSYCGKTFLAKGKCSKKCPNVSLSKVQFVNSFKSKPKTPIKKPKSVPQSCRCAYRIGLIQGKRGGYYYLNPKGGKVYCGNKVGIKTKSCP